MNRAVEAAAGPRRSFVVFHMGRCGSTVLEDLLRGTGEVAHGSEVFERFYHARKKERPNLTPRKFLRRRRKKAAARGKIYGFEIKYPSGTHLERIGLTRAEAPAFFSRSGFDGLVLLTRANLLDRLISQIVALKRGAYVRLSGDTSETGPVHVPLNRITLGRQSAGLLDMLEMLDQDTRDMRAALQAQDPGFLDLTYEEDVLGDPNKGARRIAEYVGLEYHDQAPSQTKVVTRTKQDLVENHAELVAELEGTRFEWMLRDEDGKQG